MSTAQYRVQASYSKNAALIPFPETLCSFDPALDGVTSGEISVDAVSATAVPASGVTTPGLTIVMNAGATNNLSVGIDDSGFVEQDVLPPGQAVYRWSTDPIYVIAAAGTTLVRYAVISTPNV